MSGARTTGGGPGRLQECRLRLDTRYVSDAETKAAAARPLYTAATWIRSRLPAGATLFDLRVFNDKQPDGPLGWTGRVRLRNGDVTKLLPRSGESGMFIMQKRGAGEDVAWYDDDCSDVKAAIAEAKTHGGHVVANRRGLGICVPAEKARDVAIAIHGDNVGLRGCPTYSVLIPRDQDPACY